MPKEIGSLKSYLSNYLSPHRPLLTDFSSYHSLKGIGGVSIYMGPSKPPQKCYSKNGKDVYYQRLTPFPIYKLLFLVLLFFLSRYILIIFFIGFYRWSFVMRRHDEPSRVYGIIFGGLPYYNFSHLSLLIIKYLLEFRA